MESRAFRKQVRVGFLGLGGIGSVHIQRLLKDERVHITALCDRDPKMVQEKVSLTGAAGFTSWKEMIDAELIDALYVCLPPFAHDGAEEYAAARGIHLFLEKPIALTLEKARVIVKAVQEGNVISQVGYHMRFGTAVNRFLSLMSAGRTGRLTLFDGYYRCNSLHAPWWRDADRSGGQIFEQVIHLYDLALLFMGQARQVTASAANLCHASTPGYSAEDTSSSLITFRDGGIASISASNCAVPGRWASGFTLVCERMVAEFTDHNRAVFTFTDEEPVRVMSIESDSDAKEAEDRAFIDAVTGAGEQLCPVTEGYRSLDLVSLVRTSAERGGLQMKPEENI